MLEDGQADTATASLIDALAKSPNFGLVLQLVRRSNLMLIGWKEKGIKDVVSLDQQDKPLGGRLFADLRDVFCKKPHPSTGDSSELLD